MEKIFNTICFDDNARIMTIQDGSTGSYSYDDISKCQILYEHARYKGKSDMFSHRVLISTMNSSLFIEMKKVYVGLEILVKNEKVYVYISKEPVIQHNKQFKEDVECAKQIKEKLDNIIKMNTTETAK